MAAGGSLFSMGAGIFALVQLRKKIKDEKNAKKKAWLKSEAAAHGGKVGASIGEFGARITSVSAGGEAEKASAEDPNKLAEWLEAGAGGVAGICASVRSAIDTVMSGATAFKDAVKIIRKKKEKEKVGPVVLDMVTELMKAGKSFVLTANGAIASVSSILKKFETAAEFVQSVPFLGGALNIAAQTIDLVVQGIEFVTGLIKMGRAKKNEHRLADLVSQDPRPMPKTEQRRANLALYLVEINVKRFKRALLSLFPKVATAIGDVISALGSILNIVGTLSSAAMGSGSAVMVTGYVMSATAAAVKVGAAAIMPIASLIRAGKQKIRDVSSNDYKSTTRRGKIAQKTVRGLGVHKHVNVEKTTAKKNAELNRNVNRLVILVRGLKDPSAVDQLTGTALDDEKANYRGVYVMIKATGLKPQDLLKADDLDAMQEMVKKAMKERDVAL